MVNSFNNLTSTSFYFFLLFSGGFLLVNQLHCCLTSFLIKIINMMPCVAFSISSRNTCLFKSGSKIMTTATLLRQDWRFCTGYGLLIRKKSNEGHLKVIFQTTLWFSFVLTPPTYWVCFNIFPRINLNRFVEYIP